MSQSRTPILQTPWPVSPAMPVPPPTVRRYQVRHSMPVHSVRYSAGDMPRFGILEPLHLRLALPTTDRRVHAMPAHTKVPSRSPRSAACMLVPAFRRISAVNRHTHSRMQLVDTASSVAIEFRGVSPVPLHWLAFCASTLCLPMSGSTLTAWRGRMPTLETVSSGLGIGPEPRRLFRLRRPAWPSLASSRGVSVVAPSAFQQPPGRLLVRLAGAFDNGPFELW